MAYQITHVELAADNPAETAPFYEELFGWKYDYYPEMNHYVNYNIDGSASVGINMASAEIPAGTTMVYVSTDDAQATLDKAVALGGELMVPVMDIPSVGQMATFRDPAGNMISLMQWAPMPSDEGQGG